MYTTLKKTLLWGVGIIIEAVVPRTVASSVDEGVEWCILPPGELWTSTSTTDNPLVCMSRVISCGPRILYFSGAISGHCIWAAAVESTNGIAAKSKSEKWNECLPSTGEGNILADVGREAESCKTDTGPAPGRSPQTGGCGRSRCTPSRGRPPRNTGDQPPHAPPPHSPARTWWQPASWRCCGRAPTPPPKTVPTTRRRTCPAPSDASSAPSTTSSKRTHASWSRYGHPPGNPRARTAETTPPHQQQHAQVTRESTRTRQVLKPAPSFSLLTGPRILPWEPVLPRWSCTEKLMFARSCTKFLPVAQNCTALAQCNPCATALAPTSRLLPSLPHFKFHEKFTSHLPDLQSFCKEMLFPSLLELLTVVLPART